MMQHTGMVNRKVAIWQPWNCALGFDSNYREKCFLLSPTLFKNIFLKHLGVFFPLQFLHSISSSGREMVPPLPEDAAVSSLRGDTSFLSSSWSGFGLHSSPPVQCKFLQNVINAELHPKCCLVGGDAGCTTLN